MPGWRSLRSLAILIACTATPAARAATSAPARTGDPWAFPASAPPSVVFFGGVAAGAAISFCVALMLLGASTARTDKDDLMPSSGAVSSRLTAILASMVLASALAMAGILKDGGVVRDAFTVLLAAFAVKCAVSSIALLQRGGTMSLDSHWGGLGGGLGGWRLSPPAGLFIVAAACACGALAIAGFQPTSQAGSAPETKAGAASPGSSELPSAKGG